MQEVLVPLAHHRQNPDTIAPLHYARETYIKRLQEADLLPLFVSPVMKQRAVDKLFNQAKGLFLMGGLDISSEHYTDEPNHEENKVTPVRDEFELQLVDRAIDENMPVLGICRGCQLIAVATGGTLHQHVPDIFTDETHGKSVEGSNYDHVVDVRHPAYIKENTKLYSIVDEQNVTVTSGHHQAVDELGDSMRAAAVSPAGVTEAIEHTDEDYFCVGLQSHPEVHPDGPFDPVFTAFKEAVAKT